MTEEERAAIVEGLFGSHGLDVVFVRLMSCAFAVSPQRPILASTFSFVLIARFVLKRFPTNLLSCLTKLCLLVNAIPRRPTRPHAMVGRIVAIALIHHF